MFTLPFFAVLVIAMIDWIAVWRGWFKVRLASKPLTLLLLILWFTTTGFWQGGMLWFGLALVFSLLGDIFLLWEKFFAPGLGSFLLAQICYVIGFTQDGIPMQWQTILIVICVACAGFMMISRVLKGLAKSSENASLKTPVIVYGSALALMLLSAVLCVLRPEWLAIPAVLASLGAALFFVSDSVLSLNKFAFRIPYAGVILIITYHVGQILLTTAVLMRYLA